jgi:hypothetical protein
VSPVAKQIHESKLLTELQKQHGYMLRKADRVRDCYTTQITGIRSKRVKRTPAVVVKLIVPEASALGKAAGALYMVMEKHEPRRSAKIKKAFSTSRRNRHA